MYVGIKLGVSGRGGFHNWEFFIDEHNNEFDNDMNK